MLVANKCDGVIDEYSGIADKVEKRIQTLLGEWQRLRGFDGRGKTDMTDQLWLSGQNLTSCQNYSGITELVQRISDFGSTSIKVPPSWDLALAVVNALRIERTPLAAASEHLGLGQTSPKPSRKVKWAHKFVTRQELSCEWQSVVSWVRPKLEARVGAEALSNGESYRRRELASISRPESALEGALWVRWG